MPDKRVNFAKSTVVTPPPKGGGVMSVSKASLPYGLPEPPFNAVLWPSAEQALQTNAEVVRVTAWEAAGEDFNLTVTRAVEAPFIERVVLAGWQFMDAWTAGDMDEFELAFVKGTEPIQTVAVEAHTVLALPAQYGVIRCEVKATATITLPALLAGQSFTLELEQVGGAHIATLAPPEAFAIAWPEHKTQPPFSITAGWRDKVAVECTKAGILDCLPIAMAL